MHEDNMKKLPTQEQKSLFESVSKGDKALMRDLEAIWDKSASYEPKVSFNKDAAYNKFMDRINTDAPSTVKKVAKTGATLSTILLRSAIAIAIATAAFFLYNQIFSYETIKTSDNVEFAMLEDGTQVWLNKHSELRYPKSFASDNRSVSLKGEAFFNVARDEDNPFMVDLSKDNVVTVLGTSFNINDRYKTKVEVSVTEGKVNLKNEKNDNLSVDLTKGFKGSINTARNEVNKEEITANILAWKESELKFNGQPLESVMNDIAIFYGIQMKFDNSNADCPYTITVDREQSVEETIAAISKAFPSIKITKAKNNLYYVQGSCK